MGAGASVADAGAPTGVAAVPTADKPKLSSQQTEKLQHNTLSFQDVENYLTREFLRADVNRDTSLDYPEFVRLVKSLHLNIRESDILHLQQAIDADKDGRIVLAEVLAQSADLLKRMYACIEPSPLDWCMMHDENEQPFYFNKRTGETVWDVPEGFVTVEEALISKTKDVKSLVAWMREQFESSDSDTDAVLTPVEFGNFLRSLKLHLLDEQIEGIMHASDTNGDGVIPTILQNIYALLPEGPHDWCLLADKDGAQYYYNKRTGMSQWEPPEGFDAAEGDQQQSQEVQPVVADEVAAPTEAAPAPEAQA